MAERQLDNGQLMTPPSSPLPQEEEQGEWEGEFDQQQEAEEYEEQEYMEEEEYAEGYDEGYEEEYGEDEEKEEDEDDVEYAYKKTLHFLLPGAENSRLQQTHQPALNYYDLAPYRDFPDEPVWDATEPIPMSAEEEEEDRKRVEYHQDTVQDIDQKMNDELMYYIALANSTAYKQGQQYPQDPLRVSMVLVEGSSSSSSSSTSQNAAYFCDSDTPYPFSSDDEDEEEQSIGRGEEISSIERTLRAQAVTALHNPSVMLLHSISMNETPTRTRLRMNRHLTGQPQPPHEYAPESVKKAYREAGGRPLPIDDHSHRQHHHTDTHASSSPASSSHSAAAAAATHQHHHHHHHHHMDSQSSHLDDDAPMDDEFGPTYFQGALND
ncbi:hypothetical protein BGZ97_000396 [Linnemannia gamsii]|uniref:Uncharacterized protein n=1 Tax=Linnemannia gamsii TaxID=64522 RepID=A0A9P6UUV8_9FUNG|nr:hypothetical protein BGZ97_000396 [Linnemannia gamsii]